MRLELKPEYATYPLAMVCSGWLLHTIGANLHLWPVYNSLWPYALGLSLLLLLVAYYVEKKQLEVKTDRFADDWPTSVNSPPPTKFDKWASRLFAGLMLVNLGIMLANDLWLKD